MTNRIHKEFKETVFISVHTCIPKYQWGMFCAKDFAFKSQQSILRWRKLNTNKTQVCVSGLKDLTLKQKERGDDMDPHFLVIIGTHYTNTRLMNSLQHP